LEVARARTHTHTHSLSLSLTHTHTRRIRVCVPYTRTHTHTRTYTRVHTHTHTHAHTRTHTGGVGLVYYSPHEEKLLNSSTLMAYVFSDVFFMYSGILILMLVLLMSIRKRWAREWVVVDLSLCAILGSWTVMATKGLSVSVRMTMLSEENAFTSWITYALLVVMLVTAVYQVHTYARARAHTHTHTHTTLTSAMYQVRFLDMAMAHFGTSPEP